MNEILFDTSWHGSGGIGRFSDELAKRIVSNKVSLRWGEAASCLNPIFLSFLSYKTKSGVFFLPGYIPPLMSNVSYVFTIHDLNHLDRHENASFFKTQFYNLLIKPGCHRAAYILTVSEFSKRRIIDWSGVSPDKVINVGNGVDTTFRPDVVPYSPGYPYLLCVSNRKLHKNESRLLRAFAAAGVRPEIRLLLTGNSTPELEFLIEQLDLSERVIFTGRVMDADLPALYRGALALVFPSLYEGFGLPVVEAMACGTPVITSNTTSLPEVAGDAALLVDPEDEQAITLAISRLVNDEHLRAHLSVQGFAQAEKFSWDVTARKVQDVLKRAAKGERG